MKYTILLALLLIGCQTTPEKKAQAAVEKWCKENANDPKSYQSVSFAEFDSTFSRFDVDYELRRKAMRDELPMEQYLQMSRDFKPSWTGFQIRHKARGKNALGALVLQDGYYYLDKNFKVTDYKSAQ